MKLLLFILGISLCVASPSLRFLQNENTDLVEIPGAQESELPGWLFEQTFTNEEEEFGEAEELLVSEPITAEEILPEEEDYLPGIIVDDVANQAFDYGVEEVIGDAVEESDIPKTKYTITKVTSYSKTSTPNGYFYTFIGEAVNQNGTAVILNVTVYYDAKTKTTTVRRSSYTVKTVKPTTPVESTYVDLDASQLDTDPEVQDVLTDGINQILAIGNQNGKIPVSEYGVTKILNAAKMEKNGKNYYNFTVLLQDDNQVLVNAEFVISIDPVTKEKALISFSYQVSNVPFSIDESAFTQLNKSEAQTNPQIKSNLDYVIKQVVKQSEQYTNVTVNAVSTQTVRNTVYYKFDVELNNGQGKTVKLNAIVAYKPETGAMDVKTYDSRTYTVRPRK